MWYENGKKIDPSNSQNIGHEKALNVQSMSRHAFEQVEE